ncbi:MAG: hypothetical protein ACM31O_01570 [Bacteroidota bacterium]
MIGGDLADRFRWSPNDWADWSWERLVYWHEEALRRARRESEQFEQEKQKVQGGMSSLRSDFAEA